MTDPVVPDPEHPPVPSGESGPDQGGAVEEATARATGTSNPRARSTGGATRKTAAATGDSGAKTPAPRRRPTPSRAAAATDGASPEESAKPRAARQKRAPSAAGAERPATPRQKRTPSRAAAARSGPGTVRPPRSGATDAAPEAAVDGAATEAGADAVAPVDAPASGAPAPDAASPNAASPDAPSDDPDLAPTKLLPPAHPPAAERRPDDETTEILRPGPGGRGADDGTTEILAPAARRTGGAEATTEILRPAVPRDGADETTELLHPATSRDGADATTELLHPGATRDGADATTEILPPRGPAATDQPDATPAHVRRRVEPGPEAEQQAAPAADGPETVLKVRGLSKRFGATLAVDRLDLEVQAGSFAGIVGPNGAGKTTTLSMVTGLLRPDVGTVHVHGIDVWQDPDRAKRTIGVLPDALRLFDRLTGAQLLHYSGVLRGLDTETVRERSADLVQAFGLEDATGRMVADYSAGMTKKIALAAAMIHSPRLLVLDEPFESVDPVSAANIIAILQNYVASGGTVVLSSHGMDLIQRVCDHVAIIVGGRVLASGTTDEVRGDQSLEDRFVELAGGRKAATGLEWLHSFTD